jgi:hypothetical protein
MATSIVDTRDRRSASKEAAQERKKIGTINRSRPLAIPSTGTDITNHYMQNPVLIKLNYYFDGENCDKKRIKMNRTDKVRRKAVKHTLPYHMTGEQRNVVSLPNDKPIPARKRPRLEEIILPTTTRKAPSLDVSVSRPPPAADNDDANSTADLVTDKLPNARAIRRWTLEEDAKLAHAVANTSNKKWGKEYKTDWPAVAALVPGRTKIQCKSRRVDILDPSIGRASGHKGKWTEIEDSKLKDAVQTHGDEDWGAIAMPVPGRTRKQCRCRWQDALDPCVVLTGGSNGRWEEYEDSKLKDAVQTHGDKDWCVIAALVPGRNRKQCSNRWHDTLNPSIALKAGRTGTWEEYEDSKLEDAVQTHGDKDWCVIAALVPGRNRKQCNIRWNDLLETQHQPSECTQG